MRSIVAVATCMALAGCLDINDQVSVGAFNWTENDMDVALRVTWSDGTVLLESNETVHPGEHRFGGFQRPCDGLGAGTVTYAATLGNGTVAVHEQAWRADACADQYVTLGLHDDRVAWGSASV